MTAFPWELTSAVPCRSLRRREPERSLPACRGSQRAKSQRFQPSGRSRMAERSGHPVFVCPVSDFME